MNTFPYESWAAALEAADGTQGYFTWGTGGNLATIVITVIAILVSIYTGVMVTRREDALFNESAQRLANKYNSSEG